MTTWTSDTCKCVIEFDDKSLKITSIKTRCKNHNDLIGDSFIGSQAQSTNSSINIANPANADGTPTIALSNAKTISFNSS